MSLISTQTGLTAEFAMFVLNLVSNYQKANATIS